MKLTVFLIVASFSDIFSQDVHPLFRISGGRETSIELNPHQLFLHVGSSVCGASLLSETVAITAAHCVARVSHVKVIAGITSKTRDPKVISTSNNIIVHENYIDSGGVEDYDIALLLLNTPLKFSAKIKPIPLANPRAQITGSEYVTGWGHTEHNSLSDVLKIAKLKLSGKCPPQYRTMICSRTQASSGVTDNVCGGDSGGPVVSNGALIGIVAAYRTDNGPLGCGLPGTYALITDVRLFRDWIRRKVGL